MASVEVYDPTSGTWSATGNLITARAFHTATLVNGVVLVAGGQTDTSILASSEYFNPPTGTWTSTNPLNTARSSHTATLLPNGKVLVAGGSPNRLLNNV